VKKEIDSKALIIASSNAPQNSSQVYTVHPEECVTLDENALKITGTVSPQVQPPPQVTNNNTNTVNAADNSEVNIQNNNVTNIIVFHPDMKLLNDHISKKDMRGLIKQPDFESLCNYSTKLLKRAENQCVRKTNLRSGSSMVHMGANKWEAQTDSQVLPKIVSKIAERFTDSIDKYKLAIQKTLEDYLEDITCDGEHAHASDKKETKRVRSCYKKTINHVSHILFNVTKEHVGALRAQALLGTKKAVP
jgi:hypothetical protein